jgi:hypothetical protein
MSESTSSAKRAFLRRPIGNVKLAAFIAEHPEMCEDSNEFKIHIDISKLQALSPTTVTHLLNGSGVYLEKDNSIIEIDVTACRLFCDRTFIFTVNRITPAFTFQVVCDRFDKPGVEPHIDIAVRERAFCYNIVCEMLQTIGREVGARPAYQRALTDVNTIHLEQNCEGPFTTAWCYFRQRGNSAGTIHLSCAHAKMSHAIEALLEQIFNVNAAMSVTGETSLRYSPYVCYDAWMSYAKQLSGIKDDSDLDELAARLNALKGDDAKTTTIATTTNSMPK